MPFNTAEAKLAAHASWAKTQNRTARTFAARQGLLEKFEREVDPDGVLPLDVRMRMAESARRAHYRRMAMKSATSRRKKASIR